MGYIGQGQNNQTKKDKVQIRREYRRGGYFGWTSSLGTPGQPGYLLYSAKDPIVVHNVDQLLHRHNVLSVQQIKLAAKADKVRKERVKVSLLAQ